MTTDMIEEAKYIVGFLSEGDVTARMLGAAAIKAHCKSDLFARLNRQLSDIDLAVFSPDVENMRFMERVRLGSELASQCQRDVELHLFSSRALANARPTNFAGYIVAHGRRLV